MPLPLHRAFSSKKENRDGDNFRFEFIQKIHIEKEPFSIENDLLTPTMKIKRHIAKRRYADVISSMYETNKKPDLSTLDPHL